MANLVELFDNIVQMQALNGVPLANGKLYVYALGRTRLMDTWSDVDGESLNTNPIILDDAGQAHVYVSDDFDYTLVVCDAYNNEVFSIDKYLYSKGEHSHADVAVAPSEHIAVSSYHVGETTVYVPYIQGELGKTYHGIEPIVVNNQENKISARNIALGVQEPLYFVEDSESACIIGASGLQPSGNYATVDWVLEHDYMQKEKLEFNESGQVTGFDGSAFAAGYVDPSDFIPWSASSTFQSAGNYATTDDLTAYQEKGDYYSASNPSGFINSDAISAMATTDFVADVSADITAMIPTALTGDYLTKESADTLYQPTGNYQSELTFNYTTDNEISGINGSAIHSEGGGSITGEYELSAGNGISINNDPINQKTVISVSADYATNSDLQTVSGEITAMIPTALTGDYLTKDSADTLYYPLESNPSGYLTAHQDLSDYQLTADMTAYQAAGNYLTADALDNVSGNWNEVSAKLDTTAFSDVSGTFLTAHQSLAGYATEDWVTGQGYLTGVDLTPYQTVEGMTAYQEAGDYLSANALDNVSGDWNQVSAKLDTTAFSDVSGTFLTAHQDISNKLDTTAFSDVSGSFLTGVPDTYLQNTDLSTEDGKVTAISGIPLSAGGDVPEGVMVESGLEYNAVNEISGYNGSAIAQYGAEKQWLTHDDTIVHVSNSAQYAFGVNLSGISADLARMMGVDETVLWSGNNFIESGTTAQLNDNIFNYNQVKICYNPVYTKGQEFFFNVELSAQSYRFGTFSQDANVYNSIVSVQIQGDEFYIQRARGLTYNTTNNTWAVRTVVPTGSFAEGIYKIVGVGRKS